MPQGALADETFKVNVGLDDCKFVTIPSTAYKYGDATWLANKIDNKDATFWWEKGSTYARSVINQAYDQLNKDPFNASNLNQIVAYQRNSQGTGVDQEGDLAWSIWFGLRWHCI